MRAAVEGAGLGERPVTPGAAVAAHPVVRARPARPATGQRRPRPSRTRCPPRRRRSRAGRPCRLHRDFAWTAEPFGRTMQMTRADGVTAHAAALTITDMIASQNLAGDSPWIQRTDRLRFRVEWSITFDVLDPRPVQRMMTRQANRSTPSTRTSRASTGRTRPGLERQLATVRRIQEEAENADATGVYVWAWPRLAVAGRLRSRHVSAPGRSPSCTRRASRSSSRPTSITSSANSSPVSGWPAPRTGGSCTPSC